MNRAKWKYMKLLKDYFPYGRACRKKFLVSIAEDIDHFVQEHEPCTYDMLVDEFGKPQEVILNYQKEIEISDIRNVRKTMVKHVGLAIGVCSILFGVVIFATPSLMFYRGYVELLVLKFLSEKDCYGYEIVKSIKKASKDKISLSVGTLYPTLYKLIDQKYISDYKKQTGERMVKVYYRLENAGRERLETLIAEYEEFSQVMKEILKLK